MKKEMKPLYRVIAVPDVVRGVEHKFHGVIWR